MLKAPCEPAELDQLIKQLEYENYQYVKMIEKENQLIEDLEKQIQSTKNETSTLQQEISRMDEDTKCYHRQFLQNRDNIESLKKTNTVLAQHEEVLNKKLETLVEKGNMQRAERGKFLEHYQNIWDTYKAKYESLPLALKLRTKEKETEEEMKRMEAVKERVQELTLQLEALRKPKEKDDIIPFTNLQDFCLHIAKLKLEALSNERQLTECVAEEKLFKQQLMQAEQKMKEEEERKAREAEEAAAKEREEERRKMEEERKRAEQQRREAEAQRRHAEQAGAQRRLTDQVEAQRRQAEAQRRQAEAQRRLAEQEEAQQRLTEHQRKLPGQLRAGVAESKATVQGQGQAQPIIETSQNQPVLCQLRPGTAAPVTTSVGMNIPFPRQLYKQGQTLSLPRQPCSPFVLPSRIPQRKSPPKIYFPMSPRQPPTSSMPSKVPSFQTRPGQKGEPVLLLPQSPKVTASDQQNRPAAFITSFSKSRKTVTDPITSAPHVPANLSPTSIPPAPPPPPLSAGKITQVSQTVVTATGSVTTNQPPTTAQFVQPGESTSSSVLAANRTPPATPVPGLQPASPRTPKTPGEDCSKSGDASPFNLERQLAKMKELASKSPGNFCFSEKSLFAAPGQQDDASIAEDQQAADESENSPFFSNIFGGSGDTLMQPHGGLMGGNLFGNPKSSESQSVSRPGFSFSGGDTAPVPSSGGGPMLSMFGGSSGPAETMPAASSGGPMLSMFGGGGDAPPETTAGPGSGGPMMSMFGGGDGPTNTEQQRGFTLFFSGSDSPSSQDKPSGGFNLF